MPTASSSAAGALQPWDTVLPRAPTNAHIGTIEVGRTRMLYAIPHGGGPAALEVIAFPGDHVAWPFWTTLPGGSDGVQHPHAAGMLGTLYRKFQAAGGIYAQSAVFVISPALAADGQPFAVYDSLLPQPLTASGEPTARYSGGEQKASTALYALLAAAYSKVSQPATADSPTPPLLLLGFSKGGIVLNQILAERAAASDERTDGASALLRRIAQVHYLDAGSQSRGAHLTDPAVVDALARCSSPPSICLHGTPRQWRDPQRRWLADEKDRSVKMLVAAGLHVREREYFVDEVVAADGGNVAPLDRMVGLSMHFRCVDQFALDLAGWCT